MCENHTTFQGLLRHILHHTIMAFYIKKQLISHIFWDFPHFLYQKICYQESPCRRSRGHIIVTRGRKWREPQKPKTSIDRSDPPKLDSARASAELFSRSFGRISASARIFMIQKKLKLLLEQKLRLITESYNEIGANLGHEY